MACNLGKGILELIVTLPISENKISSFNLRPVNLSVSKSILDEILPFADHIVPDLGLDVPFS